MKRLYIFRFIIYGLLLFLAHIYIISCTEQKEKEDLIFITQSINPEYTIDFYLIDCLNESNKKSIDLANFAFYKTNDVKTLQLLSKIEKDQKKINTELKKLTEKNLIIIPKLVYYLNLNNDSLEGKNAAHYLSYLLNNEIINQITVLNQIEKNSQNIDLKILAAKSKKTLQTNNDALTGTLHIQNE